MRSKALVKDSVCEARAIPRCANCGERGHWCRDCPKRLGPRTIRKNTRSQIMGDSNVRRLLLDATLRRNDKWHSRDRPRCQLPVVREGARSHGAGDVECRARLRALGWFFST